MCSLIVLCVQKSSLVKFGFSQPDPSQFTHPDPDQTGNIMDLLIYFKGVMSKFINVHITLIQDYYLYLYIYIYIILMQKSWCYIFRIYFLVHSVSCEVYSSARLHWSSCHISNVISMNINFVIQKCFFSQPEPSRKCVWLFSTVCISL